MCRLRLQFSHYFPYKFKIFIIVMSDMKCSSKFCRPGRTSQLTIWPTTARRGYLTARTPSSAPLPLRASLLPTLPILQRDLRPKPVELSPTLLGPPQSPADARRPATLSTSATAALWERSARSAAGLRLMGKKRAGRGRPPPLPPYGEGARGAAPTSVVG
jgi:hypothetical protein